LYRLKEAGYASLLVGGCVRDLLLGREPKDFDVVTDARPEEIRRLFRNSNIIGRRFRLVHVRFGREIIEVATFRAMPVTSAKKADEAESASPALTSDNIFGTQEEDARRRDFTVNALYYNISDFSVMDYVGGVNDLNQGVMRMIGDPQVRFREDPVRMLRVVRFAVKLGFNIEDKTAAPIRGLAPILADVPPARMFEEVLKLFHGGYALETYELLRHYDLFRYLFPLTDKSLEVEESGYPITLLPQGLANTDARIAEGKPVTPAFLFAAVLWEPVRLAAVEAVGQGVSEAVALARAADDVLREQLRHVSIPKRFSIPMKEIWFLQKRFEQRTGQRPLRLLQHPRFRAAYDFLLLRAQRGEVDMALAEWWTRFQEVPDDERKIMIKAVAPAVGKARRRRRRRKKSV